jgi:predicted nucleotidyltransferase
MRLNENQINAIKTAVAQHFSPESQVFLFGSRADDTKKGGDIDLLVETTLTGTKLQEARLLTMGTIQRAIGEQKIDIVTIETGKEPDKLIQTEAIRTGILL